MGRSKKLAPISVRIAALEVLETLLTVAGAFRSDGWRSKVDHLLITVASNACKVELTDDIGIPFNGEVTPICQDLQLAALRALLASFLSPGWARPLHVAQGLELFCKGTRETRKNIAEYCQRALLALEALLHPRALHLVDFQAFADDSLVVSGWCSLTQSGSKETSCKDVVTPFELFSNFVQNIA